MFFRGKGLGAVLAEVRLGARVRIDVSLQGVVGLKAGFAEMTGKGLFSCVGKQVTVELAPVPELPAAVGTLGTHHAEITDRPAESSYSPLEMAEKKLRVHFSDVPQDLQVDAVEWAAPLIEGKKPDSNIAQKLKGEFDKKYHPSWHVIVGKQFGAYVSNEEGSGLYFTYGQTSILIFKAG